MKEIEEQVLVVNTENFYNVFDKDLFNTKKFSLQSEFLEFVSKNAEFLSRVSAEKNFLFKQIIPYVAVVCGDSILVVKRTKKQSEGRLHEKLSIGIGGHVNDTDFLSIDNAMMRELSEEVRVGEIIDKKIVGIINDDSDDVGRVHLGVAYVVTVKSLDFEILEKDKMIGKFEDLKIVKERVDVDNFENWSKLFIKNFL